MPVDASDCLLRARVPENSDETSTSDATTLAGPTSVVWDAGMVLDGRDLDAVGLECGDRRLPTGARASDPGPPKSSVRKS